MKRFVFFLLTTLSLTATAPLLSCNCRLIAIHEDKPDLDQLYSDLQKAAEEKDMKKSLELYDKARELDIYFPKLVDLEDGSYLVTNLHPDCITESFRNSYAAKMVHFNVCIDNDDVEIEGNNLHVYPKMCKKKALMKKEASEWCKDNCDTAAFALGFTCNGLRARTCIMVCLTTVESLRRACKYCCNDGGFLNRCLWPLADYFPRCDCEDMDW